MIIQQNLLSVTIELVIKYASVVCVRLLLLLWVLIVTETGKKKWWKMNICKSFCIWLLFLFSTFMWYGSYIHWFGQSFWGEITIQLPHKADNMPKELTQYTSFYNLRILYVKKLCW